MRVPDNYTRTVIVAVRAAPREGRIIRIKVSDLDAFIEACKIEPGTLGHLYTGHDLDDVG